MIENVEALETAFKMDAGTIQAAIDSDDKVTLEIPTLVIRTKEDEETRDANKHTELKKMYENNGLQVAIKEKGKELGIELGRDGKDIDTFARLYKDKVLKDADINPDKKVKELTEDLSNLQGRYTTLESDFNTTKATHSAAEQQRGIDGTLLREIKGSLSISNDQVLTLFKSEYGTELNDTGALLIKKNGQTLKNDLSTPLTATEVMEMFTKPFIKEAKATGGSGGGDETGVGGSAGKTPIDRFTADMAAQTPPIPEGSQAYAAEMHKQINAGTLKI